MELITFCNHFEDLLNVIHLQPTLIFDNRRRERTDR